MLNIVERPEIRSLSSEKLKAFFNAVKSLHSSSDTDVFNQHSAIHYNNSHHAHGVPAFFPWHREFLRSYELALQKVDPSVVLPYWDWSIDSQAPEHSPILTNAYFGGNGRSLDSCVRNYNHDDKISAFCPPETLEAIISQATTYDQIRTGIEGSPHGAVHIGIGGSDGDLTYIVNLPEDLTLISTETAKPQTTQTSSRPRRELILNAGHNNLSNKFPYDVEKPIFVSPIDRTTRQKIRTPEPLPQAYIDANHLNTHEVRSQEKSLALIIESLNALPGFIPHANITIF
ncbi:hypothetical protein L0F63_000293 [Massospora cicadina]|nr:hypothetical protein L0F63_000293 [Massospora cicadina]